MSQLTFAFLSIMSFRPLYIYSLPRTYQLQITLLWIHLLMTMLSLHLAKPQQKILPRCRPSPPPLPPSPKTSAPNSKMDKIMSINECKFTLTKEKCSLVYSKDRMILQVNEHKWMNRRREE